MNRSASAKTPRPLTARFAEPCLYCKRKIPVGTRVWWVPGVGTYHLECALVKRRARSILEEEEEPATAGRRHR